MTKHGLTVTRTLDAPPHLVFRAWTDPAHLGWYFNAENPVNDVPEVDLRVGGTWRIRMFISADTDYYTGGVYREIVPDRRLVFTWGAEGGWPKLEDDFVVTLTFDPVGEQTEMVLRLDFPDGATDEQVQAWLATGMNAGWNMTIDRLVEQLALN